MHQSFTDHTMFMLGSMIGGDYAASITTLPFVLDDLGCNGSENNLLECLPQHNCESSTDESAGVRCLRKGTFAAYVSHVSCKTSHNMRSPHIKYMY